jgi:transposase InsO family protein
MWITVIAGHAERFDTINGYYDIGISIGATGGPIRCWLDERLTRHTGKLGRRNWRPDDNQNRAYPSRQTVQRIGTTSNRLCKAEVIHRQTSSKSIETVELATFAWVDWFNHHRFLEPIGNIPPAEAEAHHYAALEPMPIAA